jgi:small subunit ribosomal protein S2
MSAPDPTPEPALKPSSAVSMKELLEAGIHFGHQTRRWHPHMKPFLYGERNGVHIIDLQHTLPRFREACEFVRELVANGGTLLFVGTKRQAQDIVSEEAKRCSMPYVHRRWLGGMLTNFRTIQKGINRYKELSELLGNEESEEPVSKKERSRLAREHTKLHKAFEGMVAMERLPDAVFVIDIKREFIAIKEAQRLQIPLVAVVDSNCDPEGIDFTVPGNDDALRAIRLYCAKLADACLEGAELFNRRIVEEDQGKPEEGEGEEAPKHGKRVVEITQPARRPARMERMAEERRKELAEEESAETEASASETPTVEASAAETPAAETPAAETPASETPAVETAAAKTPASDTTASDAAEPSEEEPADTAEKTDPA